MERTDYSIRRVFITLPASALVLLGGAGEFAADDGLKTGLVGVPNGPMAGWGVSNGRGKVDAAVGMQMVDRYWIAL